jgi:hypothetical protein
MKVYDAVSLYDNGPAKLKKIIKQIALTGRFEDELVPSMRYFQEVASIIKALFENDQSDIPNQMLRGNLAPYKENFKCVLLQSIASDRWKRFSDTGIIELTLGIPKFGKVVTISLNKNTENISQLENLEIFSPLILSNVSLYPFFNRIRAHAYRDVIKVDLARKYALATLSYMQYDSSSVKKIGQSCSLEHFVPLTTNEGMRLGFFFAVVGSFSQFIEKKMEFGINSYEFNYFFKDPFGEIEVQANYDIFKTSLSDELVDSKWARITDPSKLADMKNFKFFLIGCWLLGDSIPWLYKIIPLGEQNELLKYSYIGYINYNLRVPLSTLKNVITSEDLLKAVLSHKSIFLHKDNVFFKPAEVSTDLFEKYLEYGYNPLLNDQKLLDYKSRDNLRVYLTPYLLVNSLFDDIYFGKSERGEIDLSEVTTIPPPLPQPPYSRKLLTIIKNKDENWIISCPKCKLNIRARRFTSHFNEKHTFDEFDFGCPKCGRIIDIDLLSDHLEIKHKIT